MPHPPHLWPHGPYAATAQISRALRFNPRTGYSQHRPDVTYYTPSIRPSVPIRKEQPQRSQHDPATPARKPP
ncbi:hypothetical protein [Acetobacter sp.]|uniref:hypothetical protein n=1 Tax=Acetobacter sp. TaxID=440 RepID=UPI0039ECEF50